MDIRQYLDSTYLKPALQAGLTEAENLALATTVVSEAITENFKLVMLRPEMVLLAKEMITKAGSGVSIGTVIDFPLGNSTLEAKLSEAKQAIADGADELDFVLDYEAFKAGNEAVVKQQVLECTRLGLSHGCVVKWIIEVAALNNHQIIRITMLIRDTVTANFDESKYDKVFIKSSTGFYKTAGGIPNGATIETLRLILANACPLPVKAAGGIRTYDEAVQMILLGVKRIGTSSAKTIANGGAASGGY